MIDHEQHRLAPPRQSVPPEARGKARLLFQEAEVGAACMEAALARIPPEWMDGSRWKGTKGSERAIEKIRRAMPREPDLTCAGRRLVGWRYLCPLPAVPNDNADPPRPCLAVKAILAQHKKPGRSAELFGMIVTLHAVERAYQRAPGMDVHAAIFQGHDALVALEAEGEQVFALPRFPLACDGGMFLVHTDHVGVERCPIAIADTFVSNDMTYADQDRDAAEWRRLIETSRRPRDRRIHQTPNRRQSK